MKEYLLAVLVLAFSISTVSYVDVAYADTLQVQTYSDLDTQSALGTASEITSIQPRQTTTMDSDGSGVREQTSTGYTSIQQEPEIDTFQQVSQTNAISGVSVLAANDTPDEINQNQPFTDANMVTIDDTIETNQNQNSGVNTSATTTGATAQFYQAQNQQSTEQLT